MRPRLPLAVLALALVASPLPAAGDSWSAGDPRHDVTTWDHTPEPEPCGTFTERTVRTAKASDITRLSVTHGPRSLRVVVRFRDVDGISGHHTAIYLRANTGDFEATVMRWERWGEVDATLTDMPDYDAIEEALEEQGEDECGFSYSTGGLVCPDAHGDLDPRRDRVVMTIKRTCLKDPRWVRVGASSYAFDPEDADAPSYHDRWVPKGQQDASVFDGPYGPRVRVD